MKTRSDILQAISPSGATAVANVSRLLDRGARGDRGGLIVFSDTSTETVIKEYCAATGAKPTEAMHAFFSDAAGFGGFCDRDRELVFINPSLPAERLMPAIAHEYFHLTETDEMRRDAAQLIAGRHRTSGDLRLILEKAFESLTAAGEANNLSEYPAYLVESALQHSIKAGCETADDADGWLRRAGGNKLADFIKVLIDALRRVLERVGLLAPDTKPPLADYHHQITRMVNASMGAMGRYASAGIESGVPRAGAFNNAEFDPDQYLTALHEDPEAFNPASIGFTFAGERSHRGADVAERLAMAKDMLAQGRSSRYTWDATGWYTAPDGFWRYEIADDTAEIIVKPIMGGYPKFREEKLRERFGDEVDVSIPDRYQPQEICDFIADLEGEFDQAEQDKNLYEVLHHPDLYDAYPSLRYTTISFIDESDEFSAAYYEKSDRISVVKCNDRESMRSSLLHEIQHAIQKRESWARGGNSEKNFTTLVKDRSRAYTTVCETLLSDARREKAGERRAANQARNRLAYLELLKSSMALQRYSMSEKPSSLLRLIKSESQWLYSDLVQDPSGRRPAMAAELEREFYDVPKRHKLKERNQFLGNFSGKLSRFFKSFVPPALVEEVQDAGRSIDAIIRSQKTVTQNSMRALRPLLQMENQLRQQAYHDRDVGDLYQHEIYRHLHGEVEARNTQARLNLSEEERREIYPSNTADIPDDKVIVMYGGVEIANPALDEVFKAARQKRLESLNPVAVSLLGSTTKNEQSYQYIFSLANDETTLNDFADVVCIKTCHHSLESVRSLIDQKNYDVDSMPLGTRIALGRIVEGMKNRDSAVTCSLLMDRLGYEQAKSMELAREEAVVAKLDSPFQSPDSSQHDSVLHLGPT